MDSILQDHFALPSKHRLKKTAELEAMMDILLANHLDSNYTDRDFLQAVYDWATIRAYERGGYSAARSLMLDAVETILLQEVQAKRSAA